MPPRFLSKQSCSSSMRYVWFGRLLTKNGEVLPLLELLNDTCDHGKELRILPFDGEMFKATPASFVALLIEAFNVFIIKHTKYTAYYTSSCYGFCEHTLKIPYELLEEFNDSMKLSFFECMNEKLTTVLDEGRSTKRSYLESMPLFEYDPRDKKQR